MNRCFFLGRLARDFECRVSQSGTNIARSSFAVDRGKDGQGNDRGADFLNVIAFGKIADFCEKYGHKGRRFLIETHVQTGSYENSEGKKVYTTDFVIDRIEFADSKPEGNAQPQPQNNGSDWMNIPDGIEEELPFN